MKTIEQIFFGDIEVPFESGNLRIEINESLVHVANASKLVNADRLLYSVIGNRSLEITPSALDMITSANSMFFETYSSTVDFSGLKFPILKNGDAMFYHNSSALGFPLDFPNLASGKNMFYKCALSAENINAILESLPRYATGSHIITFTRCPGAAACDPEIATTKGWTVEI